MITLLQVPSEATTIGLALAAILGLYGIVRLFLGRLPSAAKVEAGLAGAAAVPDLLKAIAGEGGLRDEVKAMREECAELRAEVKRQGDHMADDVADALASRPLRIRVPTPSGGIELSADERHRLRALGEG